MLLSSEFRSSRNLNAQSGLRFRLFRLKSWKEISWRLDSLNFAPTSLSRTALVYIRTPKNHDFCLDHELYMFIYLATHSFLSQGSVKYNFQLMICSIALSRLTILEHFIWVSPCRKPGKVIITVHHALTFAGLASATMNSVTIALLCALQA